MKLIGRGWQYSVYELGNGRVLKKYNSKLIGYAHMFRVCFPFTTDPIWKLPGYYRGCKHTAIDSMKKIPTAPLESWMMGNPKILNELDYEQDKIMPLHTFFDSADMEAGKKAIDSFADFSKLLVERKLIDKSFNITKNFGIDDQNRIILLDLGELYSSQAAIDKQVGKRAWAAHYVVNPLPEGFRSYFVEKMDAVLLGKPLKTVDLG